MNHLRIFRNSCLGFFFKPIMLYNGGGGGGSQDTSMVRQGASYTTGTKNPKDALWNLAYNGLNNAEASYKTAANRNLFAESDTAPLNSTLALDPYSGDFAKDTEDFYDQEFRRGLAYAKTGENNVMAPIVRGQSFRESDAALQALLNRAQNVREFQDSAANNVNNAMNSKSNHYSQAQQNANNIASSQLSAPGAWSDSFTDNYAQSIEDLVGKGSQTTSSWNMSAGCCWIFLEAYYGEMPWWVRECRDELAPESSARREGYRKMASVLVDKMKESEFCRTWVWQQMVLPITLYGGYLKGVKGYEQYGSFKCITDMWFNIWEKLGENKDV